MHLPSCLRTRKLILTSMDCWSFFFLNRNRKISELVFVSSQNKALLLQKHQGWEQKREAVIPLPFNQAELSSFKMLVPCAAKLFFDINLSKAEGWPLQLLPKGVAGEISSQKLIFYTPGPVTSVKWECKLGAMLTACPPVLLAAALGTPGSSAGQPAWVFLQEGNGTKIVKHS